MQAFPAETKRRVKGSFLWHCPPGLLSCYRHLIANYYRVRLAATSLQRNLDHFFRFSFHMLFCGRASIYEITEHNRNTNYTNYREKQIQYFHSTYSNLLHLNSFVPIKKSPR